MNVLHDIDPGTKEEVNVIIEIPKGSHNEYKIDKKTGIIKLDRVMQTAEEYPFDSGFIPQTLSDDGDALDAVVFTTHPLVPGVLVAARPIGVLHMTNGGKADDKIIAVASSDPHFDQVRDIHDADRSMLKEVGHFFATDTQIEKKEVVVGRFEDRAAAEAAFTRSRKMYDFE